MCKSLYTSLQLDIVRFGVNSTGTNLAHANLIYSSYYFKHNLSTFALFHMVPYMWVIICFPV